MLIIYHLRTHSGERGEVSMFKRRGCAAPLVRCPFGTDCDSVGTSATWLLVDRGVWLSAQLWYLRSGHWIYRWDPTATSEG